MWLSVEPRDAGVLDAHWSEKSAVDLPAKIPLLACSSKCVNRIRLPETSIENLGSGRPDVDRAYYSHPVEDAITYEIVIGL